MKTKWFAFISLLAAIAFLAYHFFPQGMEWYRGLFGEQPLFVDALMFGGALMFVGTLGGVFCGAVAGMYGMDTAASDGMFGGMAVGVLICVVSSIISGQIFFGVVIGASFFVSFDAYYFIALFLVYLIKETKKSRQLQRTT